MLHAAQPWLSLLDPGPDAHAPGPAARRRRGRPAATKPATARVPSLAPADAPSSSPDALHLGQLRALRWAVLGLVIRWNLTGLEAITLLGEPLASEAERLERMQALSRVSGSLLFLLPERERCRAFLRGPCPALGDAAPLELMLAEGCPGMARVSAHLAAPLRRPLGG